MEYDVVPLSERPDLFRTQDDLCESVWPEFMLHDPVANGYWMPFIEAFKDHQLMLMQDEEILAVINAVPVRYDGELKDLPEEGWDWGVRRAVDGGRAGTEPNLLLGLQIVINPAHQGKGLSSRAVKEMGALARRQGYDRLIIPVRPSDKHRYPLIPMDDYITWTNPEGLPLDNWLRVHVRAGATIVKPCHEAMRIPGTVGQWSEWTGMTFPGSGSYIVPGALNPVSIDLAEDKGLYVEPNVWVLHETAP